MSLEAQNLGQLIDGAAKAYGNRPALVIHDEIVSYRELADHARALAGHLRGAGLEQGDRVAIWLPNGRRFVELAFGCAMAGLIIVPLNTRLRSVDASHALKKGRAMALFFTQEFLGIDYFSIVRSIIGEQDLGDLRLIVNVDDGSSPDVQSLAGWRVTTPLRTDFPTVGRDDPAMINFTSGTTSSPKGAVIGHRTLIHIAREVGHRMQMGANDRMMSAMPFYHNGGFVPTLLTCITTGCTLYTQPKFDPDYVLNTIDANKCTIVSGVGTMFTMMLDSPAFGKFDVRSVRAMRITGPGDMRRAAYEKFGHPMLYSLYGMAESTAAVTLTCPGDSLEEQLNTNGKPLPGASIRITSPDGRELPTGAQGEIWIGGSSCLMQGYFMDPEATAGVLTADGWMRSGDLGYMDDRGNLVLVGRIKDMYRSGGENVACAEVEELLRSHPAVLHAAVLGVPDPRLDEVGFAFIELRPGFQATVEEIRGFCRGRVANFKVPRYVNFRKGMPMTVSGRVEKHKLRDEAALLSRQLE